MRLLLLLPLLVFCADGPASAAPGACRQCAKVCSARNKVKYKDLCETCMKECAASSPQAGPTAAAETGASPEGAAPKRRARRRTAAPAAPAPAAVLPAGVPPPTAAPAAATAGEPPPKSCGRDQSTGEEDFSCLDDANLARRLQFEKAVQAKVIADPVCDPIGDGFDSRKCELATERHGGVIARIEKLAAERVASQPQPCQSPELTDDEYCRLSCGECGQASDGRYLPMGKFTTKARDELRKKGKVKKAAADAPDAKIERSIPIRREECVSQNEEVCAKGCARLPETGRPPNQLTCQSSCKRKAAAFCKGAPIILSD